MPKSKKDLKQIQEGLLKQDSTKTQKQAGRKEDKKKSKLEEKQNNPVRDRRVSRLQKKIGPNKGLRLRTKPMATARKQNLIQTGLVKLIPARATRSIKERFSQYLIKSSMIIDKT